MDIVIFVRAAQENAAIPTGFCKLTVEGKPKTVVIDPNSGEECEVACRWTMPNVFGKGDDGKLIEVTEMQMPIGYATRHPPSSELSCDFCQLKRPSLLSGTERRRVLYTNFLVKHCGHSLCMRVKCLRKHADCKEEREHCDICYKHVHERQKWLTKEAAINMEGSSLMTAGLLRYEEYTGYEDNDEIDGVEPLVA